MTMTERRWRFFSLWGTWCLSLCALVLPAVAQDLPVPPPVLTREAMPMLRQSRLAAGGNYSIGQPTGEEQYHLELINRARANPSAEGARLASSTDAAEKSYRRQKIGKFAPPKIL